MPDLKQSRGCSFSVNRENRDKNLHSFDLKVKYLSDIVFTGVKCDQNIQQLKEGPRNYSCEVNIKI